MADGVRKVQHYGIYVEDTVGAAARLLEHLGDLNFIAMWGYTMEPGKARLELIPEDPSAFAAAAKAASLNFDAPTTVFYLTGDDRRGAMAAALGTLARAGISVGAAHGISDGRGGYGAIFYVAADDVQKTAAALGAT